MPPLTRPRPARAGRRWKGLRRFCPGCKKKMAESRQEFLPEVPARTFHCRNCNKYKYGDP